MKKFDLKKSFIKDWECYKPKSFKSKKVSCKKERKNVKSKLKLIDIGEFC